MSRPLPSSSKQSFVVVVTGQVESGYFPSTPSLYVRSSYFCSVSGGWTKLAGEDSLSTCCTVPTNGSFVLDLPLSATFRGTSPYRWPQIVLSCYGIDAFGHDVCRGYGACPIPTVPGSHTREVACFVPQSSSTIQSIVGWVTGRRPEYVDPAIVAQDEGREVTRVATQGILRLTLSVIIRGTKPLGFDLIPSSLSRASEFPMPDFQIATSSSNPPPNDPEASTSFVLQPVPTIVKSESKPTTTVDVKEDSAEDSTTSNDPQAQEDPSNVTTEVEQLPTSEPQPKPRRLPALSRP